MSTIIPDQPASPARRDWRFIMLTGTAFMTAVVPLAALYHGYPKYRVHPFSMMDMFSVAIALPWYWSRVARDRIKVQKMEASPESKEIALDSMYRGLNMTSLLVILSIFGMRMLS